MKEEHTMKDFRFPDVLIEQLAVIVGMFLLLAIPFVHEYSVAQASQLSEYIFYITIAVAVRSGAIKVLLPFFEQLAKSTENKYDDMAVEAMKKAS